MSKLLAFNITGTAVTLAAGGSGNITLPKSISPPLRGPAMNITTELKDLSSEEYTAINAQVLAEEVIIEWEGRCTFLTPGLRVILAFSPARSNATRGDAADFEPGGAIWNTDDNAPNFSDGTNWRNSQGNLT